jgi:hypothetical protein
MSALITSFFTRNGLPETGLTPTIRVWEVNSTGQTLLIGAPNGSISNTDGVMTELVDAPSQDGFYKFDFTALLGFSDQKSFTCRVYGGSTLPNGERYQIVTIDPTASADLNSITQHVWDVNLASHLSAGSTGEKLAQIGADTSSLAMSMPGIVSLLNLLLKYDTNRTKIDPVAKTLTVFDNDCTTILRTFDLFDSNGIPSVSEVCERVPVFATDGKPTC